MGNKSMYNVDTLYNTHTHRWCALVKLSLLLVKCINMFNLDLVTLSSIWWSKLKIESEEDAHKEKRYMPLNERFQTN